MLFRFLLTALFVTFLCAQDGPILQTTIGEFEGKILRVGQDEVEIEAYYGLPFAEKPFRFEKPISPKYHPGKHLAVDHKPACSQTTFRKDYNLKSDEDCLYLNLLMPSERRLNFPLVIFIHGGAYMAGSAADYMNEYVAEHYAAKGIIVAIVQYRLGVLGLASSNESDFGGNYALWDVRQSLIFLRENAANLGVDLNRITLWGYSAGASIVSHLSLSHQTRDLFSQAIQMSGSAFNEWSFTDKTVETTHELAETLECNQKDLKECLQVVDINILMDTAEQMRNSGKSLDDKKFAPHFDNDFFHSDLLELLKTAPPKPTLYTILENEALVFVAYDVFKTSFNVPKNERDIFDLDKFEQRIKKGFITHNLFGAQIDEVADKVLNFYVRRHGNQKDSNFYIIQYSHFVGDLILSVSQVREIYEKLKYDWPTYTILNAHRENLERNYNNVIAYDTVHACDIPYLFGIPLLGDTNFTESDIQYRDKLVNAVVNFIKSGSPNSHEKADFVEATKQRPLSYTKLSCECEKQKSLFEDKLRFWQEIMEDYGVDTFFGRKVQMKNEAKKEL